jgi:hypothetical protein
VVSGIACSLDFFTCGSIFLALRQDRINGLVNCGSQSVLSSMVHQKKKIALEILIAIFFS